VDAKQHKVTLARNVDSNTLIKKLKKSGIQAKLWSDFLKNPGKSKKNKDSCSQNPKEQPQNQASHNKLAAKGEKVAITAEQQPQKNAKPENSNFGNDNIGDDRQEQVKEVRFDGNIPDAANRKSCRKNAPAKIPALAAAVKRRRIKGMKGSPTSLSSPITITSGEVKNLGEGCRK